MKNQNRLWCHITYSTMLIKLWCHIRLKGMVARWYSVNYDMQRFYVCNLAIGEKQRDTILGTFGWCCGLNYTLNFFVEYASYQLVSGSEHENHVTEMPAGTALLQIFLVSTERRVILNIQHLGSEFSCLWKCTFYIICTYN